MEEVKGELENNFTASGSSEEWDSDEEGVKDIEYQPIPQEPIENGESLDVSDNDNVEVRSKEAVMEDDDRPRLSMDQGHADVVVKAMEGFTLSSNSIPEWAKVVPEEVWKNELLAGLKPNKSLKRDSR